MKPTRQGRTVALIATIVVVLSACGETPQSGAKSSKAGDHPPWDAAQTVGYGAAGFQPGDRAAWEQQMRTRAQNQNEYARTP